MPRSNGAKFTITDVPRFQDHDVARAYLEAQRWPDGDPTCPQCGEKGRCYRLVAKATGKTHGRKGLWKCGACRKQFSVTIGTIFEDSKIPLNKWLLAIHLLTSSKKGFSAHQLHRNIGLTYKSAWFLMHRIRYSMTQEPLASKLTGIVEVDETYIGGKMRVIQKRPMREHDQEPPVRLSGVSNKAAVVSVLQRGGRVQSMHVERVTAENLKPVIDQMVCESAHLMTDSSTVLRGSAQGRKHDTVNHTIKEYVRYEDGVCITTNGVEGFFGLLKRGINGVYHHVGKHHLHRYLTEFDFRYNARDISDPERARLALSGTEGKRLMYRDSCGKKA